MDKWEYGSAFYNFAREQITSTSGFVPNVGGGDLQNYLDRAGGEGWELIAFVPRQVNDGWTLFFKRRTVEEPQAETPDFWRVPESAS